MYFSAYKRHRFNNLAFTLFFITGITYFIYHAINGERGLLVLLKLSNAVERRSEELDVVRAERLHLEHRVTLMRPNSLDLDLVDEQARRLLGYAAPTERVIFMDKKKEAEK